MKLERDIEETDAKISDEKTKLKHEKIKLQVELGPLK